MLFANIISLEIVRRNQILRQHSPLPFIAAAAENESSFEKKPRRRGNRRALSLLAKEKSFRVTHLSFIS